MGSGGSGNIPYYLAREKASVRSVQFMADSGAAPSSLHESIITVNSHQIKRYTYKGVVCYFLRLPDGKWNGKGFPGTGKQSLQKLRTGAIAQITAIDNSATYTSWSDLTKTLKGIVNKEKGSNTFFNINKPATDKLINPDDHSDNYNAGFAAADAVKTLNVGYTSWVGDDIFNRPANLSTRQSINKTALFSAYVTEMTTNGYSSDWIELYISFLDKSYKIAGNTLDAASLPGNEDAAEDVKAKGAALNAQLISKVYPNPAARTSASVNVELNVPQPSLVKFSLASSTGAIVATLQKTVTGEEKVIIPLKSGIQPGAYTLTIINGNKKESREIIIQ